MFVEDKNTAIAYFSAYVMEWTLSVDNVFVFIIIFDAFNIKEKYVYKVLMIGVLLAIIFRIIFIFIGIEIINRFEWIIYVFGVFLLYTGYKMFITNMGEQFKPNESKIYKLIQKYFSVTLEDGDGHFYIKKNNKRVYTSLFVVVLMLGCIDIIFAIDSIPAVLGISNDTLVIYSSNLFAILGLRSLFYLLRGAVNKFRFMQKGVSLVLIFIGVKMLLEHFIVPQYIDKSALTILTFIFMMISILGSIFLSVVKKPR